MTAAEEKAEDEALIGRLNASFERGRNPSVKLLGGQVFSLLAAA